MAKIIAEKQVNSFVKGLITTASPLTYPENASLDEENFDLEINGSRRRRLGVDYEVGYATTTSTFSDVELASAKQSFHVWEFPGGSNTVVLGIVRINYRLWFVNLLSSSPSANLMNQGNNIVLSGIDAEDIEVAIVNNFCVIVSNGLSRPIILSYDKNTDVVSVDYLDLKARDIWGVYDGLGVDERPTTLSSAHQYNLRNQGWSDKITTTCGTTTTAINCTFNTIGKYPSNADIWTFGKVGDSTSTDFEKYSPAKLVLNSVDNSSIARGHYIIDIYNRGTSRNSQSFSTVPLDRELGSVSTACAYASRVFYSGVKSNVVNSDNNTPNYSGYVFFTQIVTAKDKLSKCYQENDPTSQHISDIVDTDGGTIHIPEAGRIVKLIASSSSLLIFAENGVWEIFGDTGGFTATSHQVGKISSIGIGNSGTIVEANGTVVYWAKPGIYALILNPQTGRFTPQNLSLNTIQDFYLTIPELAKKNARGFYDEIHNHIRWIYNDSPSYSETNYLNNYTKELNFDLALNAFYKYSISSLDTASPKICAYVRIPNHSITTALDEVYVGDSPVIVTSGESVTTIMSKMAERLETYGFLTLAGTSFTISRYKDVTFMDWKTANGIGKSFTSFLLTGYQLFGDILRKKQVPNILFYFEKTESGFIETGGNLELENSSSCLVQAQWNWTNDMNSGKWGQQFQAYRLLRPYIPSGPTDPFTYGDSVIVTKSRLRGKGRTISLKISSEEGKDLVLLGWAMEVTGDSKP